MKMTMTTMMSFVNFHMAISRTADSPRPFPPKKEKLSSFIYNLHKFEGLAKQGIFNVAEYVILVLKVQILVVERKLL